MINYMQLNEMAEPIENFGNLFSNRVESSLPRSFESISVEKIIYKAALVAIIATSLNVGMSSSHKEPFIYTPIDQSISLPSSVSMGSAWINGIHSWQDILDVDQEKPFLAMYKVTSKIDGLLSDGKFSLIDNALSSLDVNVTSVGLLVSILSSTYFAKSKLPSREYFYQRVQTRFINRGENKPGLLDGLI